MLNHSKYLDYQIRKNFYYFSNSIKLIQKCILLPLFAHENLGFFLFTEQDQTLNGNEGAFGASESLVLYISEDNLVQNKIGLNTNEVMSSLENNSTLTLPNTKVSLL